METGMETKGMDYGEHEMLETLNYSWELEDLLKEQHKDIELIDTVMLSGETVEKDGKYITDVNIHFGAEGSQIDFERKVEWVRKKGVVKILKV